ncbi:MAG: adenylate/guanylate cyclase domain-containing protein [Spirochaetales bacterium]|nr:adenylate/guanylate cyclase domain-containing protein [Spirochaetales bacterium]
MYNAFIIEENEFYYGCVSMKIKYPISLKQILLFSFLIILVLGVSTTLVSTLIRQDDKIKAEENNLTLNGRTAQTVQSAFENIQSNSYIFFKAFSMAQTEAEKNDFINEFFLSNPDVLFVLGGGSGLCINPSYSDYKNDIGFIVQKAALDVILDPQNQNSVYSNISSAFDFPAIMFVYKYGPVNNLCAGIVGMNVSTLCDLMGTGSNNTTVLVDKDAKVLINPDFASAKTEYTEDLPRIKELLENSGESNSQNVDNNFFTAIHQIKDDLFVITKISEKSVYAVINRTTYRIVLFSLAVLFAAIILIRIFSNGITNPIKELVAASAKIEHGEFELDIKPRTRDEIGLLTSSFVQMGKGLSEREKLMTSFSKFTNKTIAQKAASGELTLGGENREATIFFSDIRSFTAMSEKMNPNEVVEFLNAYMTKMVACVNKTDGVVDKYIGDAIMAVWGAPESSGSPAKDALCAVTAALMMRIELFRFNKVRAEAGLPPVRIGCGINSGPVVAGQIGSEDRMEYTVIGDAVNLASRTEALNKPFATDILITENTYNLIKDKIIVEQMPGVHVKGKTEAVKLYAVINITGKGKPESIEEVRKIIGTKAPDLAKVNTDDEEKKYSIQA